MAATVTASPTGIPATARVAYGTNSVVGRRVVATVAFDASYPTGGYALTAANFGLTSLETVKVQAVTQAGTRLALWNQGTGKLQVFSALGTEVVNTTDIHTDSVIVEATGV